MTLLFFFSELVGHNAFPCRFPGAPQSQQIDDQHYEGDARPNDQGLSQGKIVHQETSQGKSDQGNQNQDTHASYGSAAAG